MTTIPDDVMQTAREAAESIFQSEAPPIETIARAILAERDRCRNIVQETIKQGMEVILAELAEPSDETVERVAQAIWACRTDTPWEKTSVVAQGPIREDARAAITAMRAAI